MTLGEPWGTGVSSHRDHDGLRRACCLSCVVVLFEGFVSWQRVSVACFPPNTFIKKAGRAGCWEKNSCSAQSVALYDTAAPRVMLSILQAFQKITFQKKRVYTTSVPEKLVTGNRLSASQGEKRVSEVVRVCRCCKKNLLLGRAAEEMCILSLYQSLRVIPRSNVTQHSAGSSPSRESLV